MSARTAGSRSGPIASASIAASTRAARSNRSGSTPHRSVAREFDRVDRSVQTDARAEPARPGVGTASGALAMARIAVDAMGGDRGPAEIIAGALAARGEGLEPVLFGPADLDTQGLELH